MTTPSLRPWYAGLRKPRWAPPNWLFGPAWTFLYLSMAVGAWLVWSKAGLTSLAMLVFLFQLFLNVIWSGLFFALRSPGLAFVDIIVLWCAILATICEFWSVVPAASWLLVPYLIWVGFAASLNYSIWRLNA
jgi:translocator protein